MDPELIAPCGMNCNLCSGYLAYHNDTKNNGFRTSYCIGCRPRKKNCALPNILIIVSIHLLIQKQKPTLSGRFHYLLPVTQVTKYR